MEYDAAHVAYNSFLTRFAKHLTGDLNSFAHDILTGSVAGNDTQAEREALLQEHRRVEEMYDRIVPSNNTLLLQVKADLEAIREIIKRRHPQNPDLDSRIAEP